MEQSFDGFPGRHDGTVEARATVVAERTEIALYRESGRHRSCGVYVARKH